MKARLPVIFLIFVLLLLYPYRNIYAQETSTPSANKKTVTSQDNPITKALNSLISLLTKNKTAQKTGLTVNSSLPPMVISDSKEGVTAQNMKTLDDGDKKEEEKPVDPGVLDNTSASYHVVSAFSTKSDEKVSGNILDELRNLLDKVLVKDKGNERAMEFVAQELPAGGNTDMLKPQTNTMISQSKDTLSSQGINIGGFISGLFKSKDEAMVDSIEFRRCMELPGSVCTGQLAAIERLETPTPTPDSNNVPYEPPPDYTPPGSYTCDLGTNYCSVDYLKDYFPSEESVKMASMICQRESGGDPTAVNRGCLSGKTRDFSIGLFQINMLAHINNLIAQPTPFMSKDCAGIIVDKWNTEKICTTSDMVKLEECIKPMQNPETNIKYAVILSGNGTNWGPWSTYKVCKAVDNSPGTPGTPVQVAGCPQPLDMVAVPNTDLYLQDFDQGCITPGKIVIHWSGGWSSAKATADWLRYGVVNKLGYPLSCNLATDQNTQLQLLQHFNGKSQRAWCVGGDENDSALNNEITGLFFDEVINNPNHPRYQELIAESDKAIQTTCWMLKKYNLPKSEIYGHYQLTQGKSDPGVEYLKYFKNRVENECN
ncbi:hypothetical protein COV53_05960 [Candidatus Gottesmanbacteria bacterium CG11_big_fil_rev_8_21_14_0_20_37_11]|uniref:N-acetylmuramoyl-L-alanine amidase domain-containing protein n=3 Tax=Candidatus Gottesmaniibacteriota TaxID=1752720 RepID=A0A2M7RR56_9BACT|nr:MAG: hypothetical protein AUJ73_02650 [Candidatus Gottesmanbacteria bacterium CG1_02_37_22]PIP32149.1 MAG: hypothetical protein COX23_06290 [Candidatus Gottesmanbacteria bacterium CG23_combo_of_CG06-09_8_20_14_all_37_19]PIR07877.1 MAG: hypothetical protein COV53_05960 [Candidatus Gottesmanbacteria bacterium CG11_big_fil_rev_8_21_14_0_20_37_11]PIZ02565.1 MAG: hypothetical protein COY59_04080 [Candidatus Gottesmanbacteria bacterium CG_4_10_14_0_8_um_filter_37_24]